MFDINNHEFISKVIKSRSDSQYIIPLYVKVYNETYSILELNTMTQYNPASFKVGFGSSVSLFTKKPFPNAYVFEFDMVSIYNEHDDETGSNTRFMVFETSDVDPTVSDFHKQLHEYYVMLSNHINGIVSVYKKEMLKELMESNES